VQTVRLYDPLRQPPSWTDIVRPDQFVVFAKRADGGAPCDVGGQPFPTADEASCLLFDRIQDARAFCESCVQRNADVAFEIFDGAGRLNPPLLVVVPPSRQHAVDSSPGSMRLRFRLTIALIAGALLLFWLDYTREGVHFVLSVIGVHMLVAAWRLGTMNHSIRESERAREERLRRVMQQGQS
jgi:hypothetical protein